MTAQAIDLLPIPAGFHVVQTALRSRNKKRVTVTRYQALQDVSPNNEHVTLITDDQSQLISFNSSAFTAGGQLPARDEALADAVQRFTELLPTYAAALRFIRTEVQERHYLTAAGTVSVPVYWIKFAHPNGSYNWVTLGPGNQLIELERESLWDYFKNRRATEMWNYDDWVLARQGQGPQLAAPNALA